MLTVDKVLEIARGEIGVKESPPGSNLQKYGKWYGWNGVPWCMIFVMWVFNQAGALSILPAKTASCGELRTAAMKDRTWVTAGFQAGDVLIFDFTGNKSITQHVGILERVQGGSYITIEGNTAKGNEDNGGAVMRRTRLAKYIIGAIRPRYEVADMDITKLDFGKITDAQVTALVGRIQAVQSKTPVSATLAPELRLAVAAGITDGKNPNAFCTRAQAAVMDYRAISHK